MIDELEYYCNHMEQQYDENKDNGLFDVLLLLEINEESTNKDFVKAIKHFKAQNGNVGSEAPIEILTPEEITHVFKDGEFRHKLYSMLLSVKFTEGIENKSIFISHSCKYSYQ